MNRLWIALGIAGLPLLGVPLGVARADGFLDTVKNYASKPEVQSAAKSGAGKAVDYVKAKKNGTTTTSTSTSSTPAAGGGTFSSLEGPINAQLATEAKANQCSFKTGTDQLDGDCTAQTRKLASALMAAKVQLVRAHVTGFKFEVSGHTDTRGDAASNKTLSEKRAAVIAKQLVARGVPPTDIVSVGMGAEKPLVSPDNTAAKQAQNRRYELRVRLN